MGYESEMYQDLEQNVKPTVNDHERRLEEIERRLNINPSETGKEEEAIVDLEIEETPDLTDIKDGKTVEVPPDPQMTISGNSGPGPDPASNPGTEGKQGSNEPEPVTPVVPEPIPEPVAPTPTPEPEPEPVQQIEPAQPTPEPVQTQPEVTPTPEPVAPAPETPAQ